MIKRVRKIKFGELEQLLELYKHLNSDDPELNIDGKLTTLWQEILANPNYFCLVIKEDDKIISSCNLIIIKNLTRGARPYALIENVVTHREYRKRGCAAAILKRAIEIAQEKNCYKVMLLTGRKDDSTLRFYEKAGFKRGEKTGLIIRL
jgi:GNAT superfamily N-acetyltransferase